MERQDKVLKRQRCGIGHGDGKAALRAQKVGGP
jgi:hypothetical protein